MNELVPNFAPQSAGRSVYNVQVAGDKSVELGCTRKPAYLGCINEGDCTANSAYQAALPPNIAHCRINEI